MKSIKKVLLFFVLVLPLILAACSSSDELPNTGVEVPTGVPAEAVLQAQQVLSQDLGIAVENIEILDTEQVEWPNACLGLEEAGETCAQVITPGWRVNVSVGGQDYEIHTDESGDLVRWKAVEK